MLQARHALEVHLVEAQQLVAHGLHVACRAVQQAAMALALEHGAVQVLLGGRDRRRGGGGGLGWSLCMEMCLRPLLEALFLAM